MPMYILRRDNGLLMSEDHRYFGLSIDHISPLLFFWARTLGMEHSYWTALHCINAIIMIIIVIHSPPREAHYPDLPPFAYI